MLPATSLHWLARPHVFSWLFLLGTVWLCEQMPQRLRRRHLAFVAIAAAAWANCHASFFLGPAIVLTYAAGAYIGPMVWQVPAMPVSRPPAITSMIALAASAATLANPYGWELHRRVFAHLSSSRLLRHVQEFQSFDFHSKGAYQVTLTACHLLCRSFRGSGGAASGALSAVDDADNGGACTRSEPFPWPRC
jgi:hypothetical protein